MTLIELFVFALRFMGGLYLGFWLISLGVPSILIAVVGFSIAIYCAWINT